MTSQRYRDFAHERAFVNGVRLHYRSGGTGPTVLLMHGWLGTSYTWRYLAPMLVDAGFHVIAPDMRGYGDSDKPDGGYDGLTLVEDMRQLLRAAGVEAPVHVVGWDMGALPAYLFAASYPDEVRSLTYLDEPLPSVNLHALSSFTKANFGGYWHFGFNHTPNLPELLIVGRERQVWEFFYSLMLYNPDAIGEEDKQEYLRTYAGAGGVRGSNGWYRDLLTTTEQFAAAIARGKLQLPVLGVGGEAGTPFVRDQLAAVAEQVQGGVIPKCGHMIAEEAPDALAGFVIPFLQQAERARAEQ
jgi:pimeloyl-ACP methyl ester carboxylesterase